MYKVQLHRVPGSHRDNHHSTTKTDLITNNDVNEHYGHILKHIQDY